MVSPALSIGVIGLIIIIGVTLSAMSKKYNYPFTILLLFIGILLGPISGVFKPLQFSNITQSFVTLALVIVLFDAGYEIKLKGLMKRILTSSKLSTFGVFFTVLLVSLIGRFMLSLSWELSVLLGALIASTDLTIVYPLLNGLKISNNLKESIDLEATLNSVLAAIVVIIIVNMLEVGKASVFAAAQLFLYNIFVGLGIGITIGYFVVKSIKKMPAKYMPHILSIGAVLFVYSITELVGASGIMAALVVGVMFGNAKPTPPKIIKSFGGEMQLLLVTFVFIILGAILDLSVFATAGGVTIMFITAAFISRFINVSLATKSSSKETKSLIFMAGPRGIMCAVLALSYSSLFEDPSLIIGLVFAVILATSVAVLLLPVFVPKTRKPLDI